MYSSNFSIFLPKNLRLLEIYFTEDLPYHPQSIVKSIDFKALVHFFVQKLQLKTSYSIFRAGSSNEFEIAAFLKWSDWL